MKFPSYKASILYGTIGMPIFIIVAQTVRQDLFFFFWGIFAFMLPITLCTMDLKPIKDFIRCETLNDFINAHGRMNYIPGIKRMIVLFLSSSISLITLTQILKM